MIWIVGNSGKKKKGGGVNGKIEGMDSCVNSSDRMSIKILVRHGSRRREGA